MFKKTSPPQIDMFKDLSIHLSERKIKILDDPSSWHNVFLAEVTQRVDEAVFEPLFNQGGRPNSPLRILLSMMVLKEGNGWSDEQLFDNCRFNIRCMKALGLCNLDDDVPVESTYYEFRRRLAEHHVAHREDLVVEAFRIATRGQIEAHNIKGEKIRMDSKLIQSNIAKSSRLEHVLETIRVSIVDLDLRLLSGVLEEADIKLLISLKSKTASNIAYPLDNGEKMGMLEKLGYIIQQLLAYCSEDSLLHRLYKEQYNEESEDKNDGEPKEGLRKVVLRKPKEILVNSLQSVHDPEATFRRKGHGKSKKQVSGYHTNVTETFDQDNPFELITDMQTVTADTCEDAFLLKAIEASNHVLDTKNEGFKTVKHVTTDAGYDSIANREALANTDSLHWNMPKHKGIQQRYKLGYTKDGSLKVYCKKLKKDCSVSFSEKTNKHVFHHGDGSRRYMSDEEVSSYFILQELLASQDPADINIRPNVESTIHQVFHRLLKGDKVKYRSKFKCNLYGMARAYWTNFKRILKNEIEIALYSFYTLFIATENRSKSMKMIFDIRNAA